MLATVSAGAISLITPASIIARTGWFALDGTSVAFGGPLRRCDMNEPDSPSVSGDAVPCPVARGRFGGVDAM